MDKPADRDRWRCIGPHKGFSSLICWGVAVLAVGLVVVFCSSAPVAPVTPSDCPQWSGSAYYDPPDQGLVFKWPNRAMVSLPWGNDLKSGDWFIPNIHGAANYSKNGMLLASGEIVSDRCFFTSEARAVFVVGREQATPVCIGNGLLMPINPDSIVWAHSSPMTYQWSDPDCPDNMCCEVDQAYAGAWKWQGTGSGQKMSFVIWGFIVDRYKGEWIFVGSNALEFQVEL